MKIGDVLIIVVALIIAVGFTVYAARRSDDGGYVEIRTDGETYLYPLDEDRELTVPGPLGDTHLHIEDGRARITDSPCRDNLCVSMGWVEHGGEWAACLPNRVFLSVEGAPTEQGIPDAVAR